MRSLVLAQIAEFLMEQVVLAPTAKVTEILVLAPVVPMLMHQDVSVRDVFQDTVPHATALIAKLCKIPLLS